MFGLIIAIVAGIIVATVFILPQAIGWGWIFGVSMFVLTVILVHLLISLIIRKDIKRITTNIQNILTESQHKTEFRQQQFMRRPIGSPQMMMQILEKEQNEGIRRAVEECAKLQPLCKWNLMVHWQINTMKVPLYFQLKDFDNLDQALKKCLLVDSQIIGIKLARLYKTKDSKLDKFFKKKCAHSKSDSAVLLYSTYAWMLVKQQRYAEALKVLVDAKKKTDNEVILRNWEHLANDRPKQFSNSGLGQVWYALGLEEMKQAKVKQRRKGAF